MLPKKLKMCDGCESMQVIWKNNGRDGGRYCKHCWSCHKSNGTSQKPKNPIPKVSSKRKKQDQEYLKLRKVFLTEHTLCEVKVTGCMMHATDVHHTRSGSDRGAYYLCQSTWLATCRSCHSWVHEHPKESRILGYLK